MQHFISTLTKREKIVLQQVLLGKSAKEIAQNLQLSFHTIKNYLNEIKTKYQCQSIKKLMAKFIDARYLTL